MVRERDLLRWLAARAPVGDDAAVLDCGPWGTLLVATDSVIDGIHLRWGAEGPAAFGYKAVARSVSDIAAMAGEPLWALLAVCLPRGVSETDAHAVYRGAEGVGCPLVGGDTAFGPTAWAVATVLGRAHPRGPVRRSGARDGDWIVVTGALGGAVRSGRHATFTPRVAEARRLHEAFEVSAMIDISDGLSTDLRRLLEASGVGCRVEADAIPVHEGADLAAALNEGEDHELLLTVRPDHRVEGFLPGLRRIGVITGSEALLVRDRGRTEPLRPGGWEHGD
ncbi:MAG: thiamine-phosphate kinase [Planctomycetota bacterium]